MKIDYWQKLESDTTYHIYNRGVDGNNVFKDDDDYVTFLKLFTKYLNPYVDVLAYCLMPNHYHLLLKIKSRADCLEPINKELTTASIKYLAHDTTIDHFLSDQLRRWFSSYAMKFNKKHQRKGPLFAPKVKRVAITEKSRITNLICYLHHNPIHHGFTEQYDDWKYSSYRTLLTDQPSHVSKDIVLDLMKDIGFETYHQLFKFQKSQELIDSEWIK